MSIDTAKLEETIRRVLAKLPVDQAVENNSGATGDGVFADMDSAIEAAAQAYREYQGRSMADRRRYVKALRDCMLRPEHLDFADSGIAAEVAVVEPTGSETQIVARVGDQEVIAVFRERHPVAPGAHPR